jgi:multiple sugar transport system permease protein/sn-glycerol 3-phosphate transport system permease protein
MRLARNYLFLLPALVILLAFVYWPVAYSVWLSVHRWDWLMPEPQFVGLSNFTVMLSSAQFQAALWRTTLFTLVSVPPTLGLALVVAVLVAPPSRTNRLLRSVYFLPTVMSAVAIGVIFDWMMNTEVGTFNRVLRALGFSGVRWLTDPELALYSIALVEVWKQFGYAVVIYAAGLQAIPRDLYEAARMDGAGARRQFWDITFPLVMPTTYFLLILSIINGFQVFTFVEVMTEGGPARATEVILYYLVRTGFDSANVGLGSAVALVLFAILLGITVLKMATIGRRVHYGYD